MKLTDLNIDCLEGILEYLELEDLLNAADSNKRLCHASKFVYIGKYSSSKIRFYHSYKSRQKCLKDYNLIDTKRKDYISVNYLKYTFQILRNFGHLISQIEFILISLKISEETRIYMIDYINYYCHETLNDIFIVMINQDFLKCFKKPFIRVKTVSILSGFLMQKNSLVWSFPKMEKLEIMLKCYATISESIANHFPYLKHFTITDGICEYFGSSMLPADYKEDECIENFKAFLKLNPQLEHLSMAGKNEIDIKMLQMFGEREQNPKSLVLLGFDHFLKNPDEKKIRLRNVEHLHFRRLRQERIIYGIPFLCEKLKSFEIDLNGPSEEYIYDFCHNNSTIRKIKFCNNPDSDDFNINYLKLAQSLPLLEEITVSFGKISIDEVYYVLTQFKFLKYFQLKCRDFDYTRLELQLNDWKISKENYYNYIFLKR